MPWRKLAAAFVLPLLLAGCASGDLLSRAEVDRTILTGATSATARGAPASGEATDEAAAGTVAARAGLPLKAGDRPAWANPATGASGEIEAIAEAGEGGRPCRRFTASRERYDGVSVIAGHTCLGEDGAWRLAGSGGS